MNRKFNTESSPPLVICCLLVYLLLSGCSGSSTRNAIANNTSDFSAVTVNRQTAETGSAKGQEIDLSKVYAQAIGDYIRLVKKEYNLTFDTLFFGKHVYGQPDDFPDISLPPVIGNTQLKLISPEQGAQLQQQHKSSFYINLIGWVNADSAEFTFVTFSNGMTHQFDCFIHYKLGRQNFELEDSRFENYLFKAK